MYCQLNPIGINIPNGIAVTAEGYRLFRKANNLEKPLDDLLLSLDTKEYSNLSSIGEKARNLILSSSIPGEIRDKITTAYKKLCKLCVINDAPALKNADIGIAMGINGTEVSKEASHLILLDDNFATIVVAVKHGRKVFDNILKFIKYIMTGNSGEIWAIFLAPFFMLPIPLLAIHILWINLVTDGLPGLALASEPAEANIMKRPPRNPKENIFSNGMGRHILWVGFLMGITTLGIQFWAMNSGDTHWQTMAFTVLCFSQMGHVMAIRSDRESLFKIGIFSNKPLFGALLLTVGLQLILIYSPFFNSIFKTQPLSIYELAITLAV